jgi:hypothetical protein
MSKTLLRTATLVLALVSAVSVAGCKSSSAAGSGGGGTSTAAAVAAGGSTATFSGDFSGTMSLNLCTAGNIGSLKVKVNGDSTVYLGSVSATSMGFVGPAGGPFTLTETSKKPTASSDGTTFDVTGVVLSDETLTHKSITVSGTLHCP